MHGIPPPNAQLLLPPILACLPTAFVSPRPPPALLPLLSPILRQKVHLLASQTPTGRQDDNSSGNWLPLLTWRADLKPQLVQMVSELQLEAHPVSGELDLWGDDESPDAGKAEYRRLDAETLQALIRVRQYGIAVIWVWCKGDTGAIGLEALNAAFGGLESQGDAKPEDGWRVFEVLPNEAVDGEWRGSLQAAEEAFARHGSAPITHVVKDDDGEEGEDDDDDYWNSYDRTPGPASVKPSPKPTPGPGVAPGPVPGSVSVNGARAPSVSELDYYARYASEVQPAMDPHDPDEEEGSQQVESGLGGSARQWSSHSAPAPAVDDTRGIHSPSPTRPPSQDSERSVSLLQRKASCSTAVELGVKQHISHELKSLFRLSQSVGIERGEFERMVRLELETLGTIEL